METTPWAVICPLHEQVFLTKQEYDTEMLNPDAVWTCPICGRRSQWDDDNYEQALKDAGQDWG